MTTAHIIPSASRPGVVYQTTRTTCTCPDHTYRQRPCKHMRALPAHRPVRITAAERERDAVRACPACGVDQDELEETARTAGRMNARLLNCWAGSCGRNA